MMNKEIFALDIGTRKVMGLVCCQQQETLEILDVEIIEHPSRPMFDGQIHSIAEVAKTVKKVKENLEGRLNKKLTQVGVAVAGRNLVTFRSKASREFAQEEEITVAIVKELELEAVDKIISDTANKLSLFYCVGYSPVYYELDGAMISTLIGHRAKLISTEVIVTFLPRVVLESMLAVLKKVGLVATNITLEPIAAINAIIPADLRHLNLILLDIGAGTADLALTKDGFVFAYGMVPEAGDEITERIAELLLIDFSVAETIKRSLGSKDKVVYEDIWGRRHIANTAEIKKDLSSSVKKLADSIAQAGLELNRTSPDAIVAVGGGAQTFGLMEELSKSFSLPAGKVGIRMPAMIKGIVDKTAKLTGPEAVTPIGIALMTASSEGLRFIELEINRKKFRMLDFQQKKDVLAALTFSGILNNKRLYPHPGLAITCQVNGELKIVKGTLGEPAKILLNAKAVSSLADKIEDGDKIKFQEAQDGQNASCRIGDLIKPEPISVVFNQEALLIMPPVVMNEKEADLDTPVPDRANIYLRPLKIIDILQKKGINLEKLSQRQILVNIDGNPKILTQRNFTLRLNGQPADLEKEVKRDERIEFSFEEPSFYRIKDIVELPKDMNNKLHINVDGRDIEMDVETVQIFMNGHQVLPDEFLIDGADVKVYYLKERKVLLSEIFRYIDFDPQRVVGKKMQLLVNEMPAGFTTPLMEGARVKIIIEDREE